MTILYQEAILETPEWLGYLLLFCVISLIVMMSLVLTDDFFCIPLIINDIIIIILLIILSIYKTPTGKNKYEVILDNNYSAEDLYSNYKVIEQRGEIWVLEDK